MIRRIYILVAACWWAACSPGTQAVETPHIGVALYSFNRFSLEDGLQKAKQSGVGYVEGFSLHRLGGRFGEKPMAALTEAELADIRLLLQEKDMQMVSMYVNAVHAKTVADWEKMFEIGKRLDFRFLVGEPEPHLWDELDELAARYKMKVALHQHAKGRSPFWHPDSVLTALQGRPSFAVCGDLGHWARSGLDPVECLKRLEGRLVSIHTKDLDSFGNLKATDVKLGSGVIDYKAVRTELSRQQFNGFIFVECEHDWEDNFGDVKAAVDLLTDTQTLR